MSTNLGVNRVAGTIDQIDLVITNQEIARTIEQLVKLATQAKSC